MKKERRPEEPGAPGTRLWCTDGGIVYQSDWSCQGDEKIKKKTKPFGVKNFSVRRGRATRVRVRVGVGEGSGVGEFLQEREKEITANPRVEL